MTKINVLSSIMTLAFISSASAGTLRVGATPVPAGEILNFVKPILAKQGVDLQIKEFSDYIGPNTALGEGSIDANLFQHAPYLAAFQQNRPLNIVAVKKIYLPPLALYSNKVKSVTDIKAGATVAVPNDPSNEARALQLLQRAGLIRLKAGIGGKATPRDIISNIKKVKIVELDAAQLPRSLSDVDAAVINANYALQINLNPVKDALFHEDKNSVYANILATTKDKLNDPDIQKLTAALTSPETKAWILKKYAGSIIPTF